MTCKGVLLLQEVLVDLTDCRRVIHREQVLVRMCDHIVVWGVQGLVRAAAARHTPLDDGQLLRLRACRDILSGALEACSARDQGQAGPERSGGGGGMYERRLGFLDDMIHLLSVDQDELEGKHH